MSASPIFSSAAMSRHFIFPPLSSQCTNTQKTAEVLAHLGSAKKLPSVVPASHLDVRPLPEMVPSGIAQLDSLTGGFPRGCLTEICGAASSGRTSVLLFALARATERGEVCALVDASDAFDPASAAAAGMEMNRLLWVRCGENYPKRKPPSSAYQVWQNSDISQASKNGVAFGRWESKLAQMLKVTDLLLQSNGFGMIALDLGDIPVLSARRISLASWFRFRRAVEHTPTVLLVLEQQPIAGSCSSVLFRVSAARGQRPGNGALDSGFPHSKLLDEYEITAELLCSRLGRKLERKPVESTASFKSRAAWAR